MLAPFGIRRSNHEEVVFLDFLRVGRRDGERRRELVAAETLQFAGLVLVRHGPHACSGEHNGGLFRLLR